MGLFSFLEAKNARDSLYDNEHEEGPKLSHELIGGAAAFEAMHLWEKRQRDEGKPVNHGFAKEALAAMAGAEADRLYEKHRGRREMEEVDREEARRHAVRQVESMYDDHYGGGDQWDPRREMHESMRY